MVLLIGALGVNHAQTPSTDLHLRLERHPDALDLVVDGTGDFGALFIYQAHDLPSLSASPSVAVQTNTPLTNGLRFSIPVPAAAPSQAFFTAAHWPGRTVEELVCGGPGMVFIPAGTFTMGDTLNDYPDSSEHPTHAVYVSGFCMDKYEVTKALWDDVYNWAVTHGYSFDNPGSRYNGVNYSKGSNHPVHLINWYDCVKWCNARSEKGGRVPAYYTDAAQTVVYRSGQVNVQNAWVKWNAGYRLPTEAEWEKASRGNLSGRRFPGGDAISHADANYYGSPASAGGYAYDLGPLGYHAAYNDGVFPYTSPVGAFPANGYGLHEMAGNVWEWCWDWWNGTYYRSSPETDPRGPGTGSNRVVRGGSWINGAIYCRSADRVIDYPGSRYAYFGFRTVVAASPP
jgi:formylglycine-generating enzyme required for sulfatase activity